MTMSTKAFDEALDFMPGTAARRGGSFGGTITAILQALADGRRAEADYKRLVVRGVDPADAVHRAFSIPTK